MSEAAPVWREHRGGACPVDGRVMVRLRFREGAESKEPARAGAFVWADRGQPFDIVAFLVEEVPEEVRAGG